MTDPQRPGRRAATPQWTPGNPTGYQLQCPNCGLANDPSARFCRNCGLPLGWPDDPVRGTTTRRADLPSERGSGLTAIVGLLAAIGLLAGAGFLVLRSGPAGGGGGIAATSPSAGGSGAHASPAASGSPSATADGSTSPATAPPSGLATEAPSEGPTGAATEEPTEAPTEPPPTEPPPTLPPSTGFTCDAASLPDPTLGRWRVSHTDWKSYGKIDEVTLTLLREGDVSRRHATAVTIESMPLSEVQSRYGLTPPSQGDRAIVVTFDGPVRIRTPFDAIAGLQAVKTVDVEMDARGVLHTVLGVAGNGCHRLATRSWIEDPTANQAQVVIDVRSH